ncbi:MAG TPA: PEPxxWA-CTERM sorting domain-containing protein [Phenylobacterium sp.]|jgi:hypothetical protein|nr:PEPxxWA-CTERM sorting domain-containing protein [Phenylobacterium sp.]
MKLATVLATASLIATGFGATAASATTVYSDRATFESQLAGHFTDDYENPGYTFFQSDAQMSSVVGQTTYQTTGFSNLDIVSNSGGDDYYCGGCNGSFQLDFSNTSYSTGGGVYGVGFDLVINETYNAQVTFTNGSTALFTLPLSQSFGSEAFWGVTSDLGITSIYLGDSGQATTDGNTGIDNLEIGAGPIPEPATWAMMLLGFGALGRALRHGRRARVLQAAV